MCACLRKDPTCKQLSSRVLKKHMGTTPLKNQQLMGDGRDVSAASSQAHLPNRLINSGQAGCSPEKDNCHRGERALYTLSSFQPSENLSLADSLSSKRETIPKLKEIYLPYAIFSFSFEILMKNIGKLSLFSMGSPLWKIFSPEFIFLIMANF